MFIIYYNWKDITMNLLACEELTERHSPDIILLESGGDNLAADFSRELADLTIYVIDTAGVYFYVFIALWIKLSLSAST